MCTDAKPFFPQNPDGSIKDGVQDDMEGVDIQELKQLERVTDSLLGKSGSDTLDQTKDSQFDAKNIVKNAMDLVKSQVNDQALQTAGKKLSYYINSMKV